MSTTNKKARRSFPATLLLHAAMALGVAAAHGQGFPMQDQGTAQTPSASSASQAAQSVFGTSNVDASESAVLRPGDTIDVQVFNTPELSGKLRIDQAGKITLPIGLSIKVDALTPDQASKAIEKTLKDQQIMYSPLVNVLVSGYAVETVTVTGEIKGPGIYPLRGSRRLSDALALAGWLNITTGSTVSIAHRGEFDHPFVINTADPKFNVISEETILQSGDTVRVAKADQIYVVGDVRTSGVFPMPNGQRYTVLTVLALCGGTTLTSKGSRAAIIRPTPTGAETIRINLDLISENKAPNLELQPSDVLVVPHSGFKQFEQYALPGLTGAVSGAAASALIIR